MLIIILCDAGAIHLHSFKDSRCFFLSVCYAEDETQPIVQERR